MRSPALHYDKCYFAWQSENMLIQATANVFKFSRWVKPGLTMLDFGCGSGMLLKKFGGGIGIEINPAAQEEARKNGLEVHSNLAEVADDNSRPRDIQPRA